MERNIREDTREDTRVCIYVTIHRKGGIRDFTRAGDNSVQSFNNF